MYYIHTLPESDWTGLDQALPALSEVAKALQAGAGVDASSFTGGRALQYESLEDMLQTVTLTAEECTLWRAIPKRSIHATVDQFNRRTAFGGRWGIASAESTNPSEHLSTINRMYANVRYYRSLRQVSDVATMVGMTVNPMEEEQQAGTIQILQALDEDLYTGDSSVFPNRVDGILPVVTSGTYDTVVYDQAGDILTGREDFEMIAAEVRNRGGRITHAFANPLLQADLSIVYQSAERIMLLLEQNMPKNPRMYAGAMIGGVATSQGLITFEGDPFCKVGATCPAAAEGPDAPNAPAGVTATATGSGGNMPAGKYYYKVCAVCETGRSAPATSSAVTITAGQKVQLTIQPPSGGTAPTGYWIYRSALNASDASDCRWLWHVAAASSGNTTFVDDGSWVPGTSHIVMMDLRQNAQARAVQWSQLLPMSMKRLAETGPTKPFLVNLYGAFRIAAPEWIAVIKNVLPRKVKDDGWNPLNK